MFLPYACSSGATKDDLPNLVFRSVDCFDVQCEFRDTGDAAFSREANRFPSSKAKNIRVIECNHHLETLVSQDIAAPPVSESTLLSTMCGTEDVLQV